MPIDQSTPMKYCPYFGGAHPWPSDAGRTREKFGGLSWHYNPWTGLRRHVEDIKSDPVGLLIVPPGEEPGTTK